MTAMPVALRAYGKEGNRLEMTVTGVVSVSDGLSLQSRHYSILTGSIRWTVDEARLTDR